MLTLILLLIIYFSKFTIVNFGTKIQAPDKLIVAETGQPINKSSDSSVSNNFNPSNDLNLSVSMIGQDDKTGTVLIRTMVDINEEGNCIFTASNDYISKKYFSKTIFSGKYYSCNYNITNDDLYPGNWLLKVEVYQNNKYGLITKEILLK